MTQLLMGAWAHPGLILKAWAQLGLSTSRLVPLVILITSSWLPITTFQKILDKKFIAFSGTAKKVLFAFLNLKNRNTGFVQKRFFSLFKSNWDSVFFKKHLFYLVSKKFSMAHLYKWALFYQFFHEKNSKNDSKIWMQSFHGQWNKTSPSQL